MSLMPRYTSKSQDGHPHPRSDLILGNPGRRTTRLSDSQFPRLQDRLTTGIWWVESCAYTRKTHSTILDQLNASWPNKRPGRIKAGGNARGIQPGGFAGGRASGRNSHRGDV